MVGFPFRIPLHFISLHFISFHSDPLPARPPNLPGGSSLPGLHSSSFHSISLRCIMFRFTLSVHPILTVIPTQTSAPDSMRGSAPIAPDFHSIALLTDLPTSVPVSLSPGWHVADRVREHRTSAHGSSCTGFRTPPFGTLAVGTTQEQIPHHLTGHQHSPQPEPRAQHRMHRTRHDLSRDTGPDWLGTR